MMDEQHLKTGLILYVLQYVSSSTTIDHRLLMLTLTLYESSLRHRLLFTYKDLSLELLQFSFRRTKDPAHLSTSAVPGQCRVSNLVSSKITAKTLFFTNYEKNTQKALGPAKEVQIVYRLFLVNYCLLHVPRLPSKPASKLGG